MAYSGKFRPKNPQKYKGDPTKIVWRSLWELKFFRRCDEHPDILEWQSEEIAIPYMNPVKGKTSRYFPDVVVKKRISATEHVMLMIEIKPKKQTRPPDASRKNNTPTGRVSRRYLNEAAAYAVNEAKWKAAQRYCRERNWTFLIFTEDEIQPSKR